MDTKKLYKQDVYLKEASATIQEIRETQAGYAIVLDRTVFFPASGGQPSDTGVLTSPDGDLVSDITDVYEEGGQIFHVAEKNPFSTGQSVICAINWERRFDHMQRHCGEHILSGIFFREYGGVNRGFHMGDEYLTIDINLEENPEYEEVTMDMALAAEKMANEVIWQNAPVVTRYYEDPDEVSALPTRKAVTATEDIAIVCVGSPENPADCVACCGTHPSTAGQVGLVKIYKVEHYKKMFRVYFDAGARALADYGFKHGVISALNLKYSANTGDLMEKIALQDDKVKDVRNELFVLKQTFISEKIAETKAEMDKEPDSHILVMEFHGLKTDDLLHIGRPFCAMESSRKLLMIISPKENTLLLFSNGKKYDCGKLVKENAHIYNGKGGGNQTSARALFTSREYLDTFIDLIEKHLR